MIKVQRNHIEISGSMPELVNELADAIRGVKSAMKNGGVPQEVINDMINDAVRYADMSQEQRVRDALDTLKTLIEKTFNAPKNNTENGGNTDDKKPE